MTESGKEWKKPELVVLVRSKPEEAVLLACKGWPNPASSSGDVFWMCASDCTPTSCTGISAS